MAVPGLISAGSSIHRLVQPGLRRSLATVKLVAVARESCFGSPVMWHFRALTLANNCRAMVRSASVSGSSFSAMNGCRSEEHTSGLQSLRHLVCRLLLEKKKKKTPEYTHI